MVQQPGIRRVVITADDAGIAVETNRAVEMAHRHGILTSASLMANMPAFEDAVAMSKRNPALGVGVHLVLTSGRPISAPAKVPLLVNGDGMFKYGHAALSRLVLGPSRTAALAQIDDEFVAQVEKARQAGLDIDHLDGHGHVHMIPGVWALVNRLAKGCRLVVRNSSERPTWNNWRRNRAINLAKTLVLKGFARANQTSSAPGVQFAGVMDSGCVNVRVLRGLLRNLAPGTSEIVTHPSYAISAESRLCCSGEDLRFLRSPGRSSELAALLNSKLRTILEDEGIEVVSFRSSMPPHSASAVTA